MNTFENVRIKINVPLPQHPLLRFLDTPLTLTTPTATAVTRRLKMSSSLLIKYQIHATGLGSSSPELVPQPHVRHGRHLSKATRRHRPSAGSGSVKEMPWRVRYVVSDLPHSVHELFIFIAQCTLVQSAVLRSHVVRPSICPSVTLVICDRMDWESWKQLHRQLA